MTPEEQKEEAFRQLNMVWEKMYESILEWNTQSLFNRIPDFPPCPIGDPDADELERMFNLESPK